MTEYCKHGLEMTQTCRRCGRIKVGSAPHFEALKNGFVSSIDRLEETVRLMQIELAKGPPPPLREEAEAEPESEAPPPPKPVERFPWQRD